MYNKSRDLDWPMVLRDEHLKPPGARPIKGDLRYVNALGSRHRTHHAWYPVGMEGDAVPLLTALQHAIERAYLRPQLGVLVMKRISPHDDSSIGDKRNLVEEEPEGYSILPDMKFRGHEYGMEYTTRLLRKPRRGDLLVLLS